MNAVHQLDCNSEVFDRLSVDLLHAGYTLRFSAQGTSMKPLIRDGDTVLIEPIDCKDAKPSEIVFFINWQGTTTLHRVIKKWKTDGRYLYLLKGDQVLKPDGIIEHANIIGRLKGLERAGENLSLDEPAFKVLNWLAYIRSRTGLASNGKISTLSKNIACLSKYLK